MPRYPRRQAPEPLDTNAVPVVLTGMALWLVAGVVLLVIRPEWLWMCLCGEFIGAAILLNERWHRSRISARSATADPESRQQPRG